MDTAERIHLLVAPLLSDADVDLYDLEFAGGVLRITLDKEGGVDIGTIGSVTRGILGAGVADPGHRPVARHDGRPGARNGPLGSSCVESDRCQLAARRARGVAPRARCADAGRGAAPGLRPDLRHGVGA